MKKLATLGILLGLAACGGEEAEMDDVDVEVQAPAPPMDRGPDTTMMMGDTTMMMNDSMMHDTMGGMDHDTMGDM